MRTHIEYDDFGEYMETDDLCVCEEKAAQLKERPGRSRMRPGSLRAYWIATVDGENLLWQWHLA